MYFFSVALIIGAVTILLRLPSIFRSWRSRQVAPTGCAPPPTATKWDVLGISRVIQAAKANRDGRVPQWLSDVMDEVGSSLQTIRAQILDSEMIISRDPMIAQAIFQTQSSEWEIGSRRRELLSPLLGDAIFTAQGNAGLLHIFRGSVTRTFQLTLCRRCLETLQTVSSATILA